MTRKEQAALASIIKGFGGRSTRPSTLARAIADYLESESIAFNRRAFLISCGARDSGNMRSRGRELT